jgi:tetratricopeptide (TPR) repeat protein
MPNPIILLAFFLLPGILQADAINISSFESNAAGYKEQIEALKSSIENDWQNTKTHNDLGEIYMKLKVFDEAEKEFRAALTTDPVYPVEEIIEQNREYARAHNNLGAILLEQNNFESAKSQYEEALKINPQYPQAHNGLGMVYEGLGQRDKAIEQYKLALEMDENSAATNYNIGLAYKRENDLENSLRHLKKAKEIYGQEHHDAREEHLGNLIAHLNQTYVKPGSIKKSYPEKIKTGLDVLPEAEYAKDQNLADNSVSGNEQPMEHIPFSEESKVSNGVTVNLGSGESVFRKEESSEKNTSVQVAREPAPQEEKAESELITEETFVEEEPKMTVLTVETGKDGFLSGKKISSSTPKETESNTVQKTHADTSEHKDKLTTKKDPENNINDPLLGEWLFEYPK